MTTYLLISMILEPNILHITIYQQRMLVSNRRLTCRLEQIQINNCLHLRIGTSLIFIVGFYLSFIVRRDKRLLKISKRILRPMTGDDLTN